MSGPAENAAGSKCGGRHGPHYTSWPCPELAPALWLSGLEPFAAGRKRHCYVHPGDVGLCVKVPLGGDNGPGDAEQRRELEDYALLKKRGPEAAFDRIPAIKGVIGTDLGLGIVSRLCRDADGRISGNLAELIRSRGLTPALVEAMDELKAWLRARRLLTRDTGPHNIVAMRRGEEEWKLMIVEGWIHRRYGWLARRSRFVTDRMIDRQLRKFDRRVAKLAERKPA